MKQLKSVALALILFTITIGVQGQGWTYSSTDPNSIAFVLSVGGGQTDSTCTVNVTWVHNGQRTTHFKIAVMQPGSSTEILQMLVDSSDVSLRSFGFEWLAEGQVIRVGIKAVGQYGESAWICGEATLDDKRGPDDPTDVNVTVGC